MFDPNNINNQQQQQQIQYQDQKQNVVIKEDQSQKNEFPNFCYTNVNMIHKISNNGQQSGSTVNMAQLTGNGNGEDNKCYVTATAQPQFSYNYALVAANQMQIAAATATQNTISNITFKCDICGLMFGHLSLLNHHKRIHNTGSSSEQITVQVATAPNSGGQGGQGQQGGQPAQIQIVATERIRYTCEDCGMALGTNSELKPLRCENCGGGGSDMQDNGHQTQTVQVVTAQGTNAQPGTIFVVTNGPDGSCADVKFEQVETTPPPSQIKQSNSPVQTQTNSTSNQSNSQQSNQNQTNSTSAANNTQQPGHHPVKRRGIASVTKCNKCNGSGIIFIGGNKRNQDDRDKPFHCNICNGSFSRYSSLWSHKRLHSGEKNFKCNICGLAFAKAAYLKNHSRIHTGEKPYRCNVCGMQFSQSPHLKNHERIHSGERPYICEVCDKSFARHSTLWNHRRIHTGEKPYRCDICGSCFNQATHLKNHAKVHSGEKPFKCDICLVGFSDRFALKRHRNIHEKYGRTKPAASSANNQANNQMESIKQNTLEASDDISPLM